MNLAQVQKHLTDHGKDDLMYQRQQHHPPERYRPLRIEKVEEDYFPVGGWHRKMKKRTVRRVICLPIDTKTGELKGSDEEALPADGFQWTWADHVFRVLAEEKRVNARAALVDANKELVRRLSAAHPKLSVSYVHGLGRDDHIMLSFTPDNLRLLLSITEART